MYEEVDESLIPPADKQGAALDTAWPWCALGAMNTVNVDKKLLLTNATQVRTC